MSHPPPRNSHGIAICVIYLGCVCIYMAGKKSNDRVTQNRFCVDELSDESISCSQAMCLWTSTFVVKPMLLISTHWLLWRCEPLGLCSETFRNPEGNLFACRCVASFPLILYSVHRSKAAIFFGADRRERDWDGDAHDRTFFAKTLQVKAVVCLSCVA